MLSRFGSACQSAATPATPIGVGIDTSRYGHYAAFLGGQLQTAAPDLEVMESAAGYARLRQRFLDLVARFGSVQPYRHGLVVGCDCLFAWYWLADLCERETTPFVLGHALAMKAIHAGKAKNDRLDAQKIA